MDQMIEIPDELFIVSDYHTLCRLIEGLIGDFEVYREKLSGKHEDICTPLEKLSLKGDTINRDEAVTERQIEIVDKTLSLLRFMSTYSVEMSNLYNLITSFYSTNSYPTTNPSEYYQGIEMKNILQQSLKIIVDYISKCLSNCKLQVNSLDNCFKSPYDFTTICNQLIELLDSKSNVPDNRIESLLKLAQNELHIIKESKSLNEDQQTVISIQEDKLSIINEKLSSLMVSKDYKPKQRIKQFRDIVDGIRLIMKDAFEMIRIFESVDWINESDELFTIINEKGCDSFDEVIREMEAKKKHWIEIQIDNETQKVCRAAALRQFNVYLKQMKKLLAMKSSPKSDWIISGIKNITSSFLDVNKSSNRIFYSAYYLTHKMLPKPRVDVPDGFIRDDEIYQELNKVSSHGMIIVLFHISKYFNHLGSLTWNVFQERKPRKVLDCMWHFLDIIKFAIPSYLEEDELHTMSFDLADRLCLAKNKISKDRDALEYRLFRFKPEKPYKFVDLQNIFKSQRSKRFRVHHFMEENFDKFLNDLNDKVINRGQLIIALRGLEMMRRSMATIRLLRFDCNKNYFLMEYMVQQAANEYCYAAEKTVKLCNTFRSNRRIPYSFNADGYFTRKIDEIGLKVKEEFLKKLDSDLKMLKKKMKVKQADLESTKDEKTQLRYLSWIQKRSKAIPLNELDLTENDEVEMLKEIIEEYEYTLSIYGPID